MRNIYLLPAAILLAAHGARAMELDTLIPPGIPGLGAAPPVSVIGRAEVGDQPVPVQFGGLVLVPRLAAGAGYDSAPDANAPGTAEFQFNPSLVAADPQAGFGAYLAANTDQFPAEPAQDVAGYTIALGQVAALTTQKISLEAGFARAAETGFGLNSLGLESLDLSKPLAYSVGAVSAGDRINAGMFSFDPQFSYADIRFDGTPELNFSETRQRGEIGFEPGGPVRLVTLLEATESRYRIGALNADSYALLAGLDDDATGLWEFRLLAGGALRVPAQGKQIEAPVFEAEAIWAPGDLTRITAAALREVDDPDQISPDGYTLTQGQLSLTQELRHDITAAAGFQASHAAFYQAGYAEDFYTADAGLTWRVNRYLAFDAAYAFAHRQTNFSSAANQHVVTLSATWTP
jgi:hypothetical protein